MSPPNGGLFHVRRNRPCNHQSQNARCRSEREHQRFSNNLRSESANRRNHARGGDVRTSDQQTQTQGDAKSPKDPEPEPQVRQSQASPMPPEASNDEVQVKLKMPLWDSLKQRSFTINDLYPCSEKEAQRLIENGTAVKADA